MKAYICLPADKYYACANQFDHIANVFCVEVKRYYGAIQVEIIGQVENDSIDVCVMDSAKYEGYDAEIKQIIKDLIKNEIGEKNVNIKLNYAIFNPNYNPKNECLMKQNVQTGSASKNQENSEYDYEKLSMNYCADEPKYSFEQVVLPEYTRKQIDEAIGIIQVEHKVFDEWGLRSIIPQASTALSFYGPPGTGKSMSAEAVAKKLNKKILKATYADIESKYHGEGPKMVKAIFRAAERENAILFLDESDSLLSKRLTNVSDGSAQAINSMRSQLLICLENFTGIVIFATNLVVNYDKAFLSRLINVEFTYPTEEERVAIWNIHLKGKNIHVPLSQNVDLEKLAKEYKLCGREIKNIVKSACVSVALEQREEVDYNDLDQACINAITERNKVYNAQDHTMLQRQSGKSIEQNKTLMDEIKKNIDISKKKDTKSI